MKHRENIFHHRQQLISRKQSRNIRLNNHKTYDNSGLQPALDRAQKAEDKALRVLAGNFEGM